MNSLTRRLNLLIAGLLLLSVTAMTGNAPASGLSAITRVPAGLENVPTTPAPSMQTQTVTTFPPINQNGCPVSSSTSGMVSGRVLNAANEPIAGSRVLVLTNTEPTRIVSCVLSRSNGYYSFGWLDEFIDLVFIVDPPVGSELSLGSTGDVLQLPQASPLDWRLGEADLAGVINLDGVAASELATACLRPMNLRDSQVGVERCGNVTPRAGGVRGFAIDSDGLNLANYQMQVSFRNSTTQLYDFVAIPSSNRSAMTFDLFSNSNQLQLAPCQVTNGNSGNLTGVVRGANGSPISGARVEVSDPELYPSAVYGCAITDAQGRYAIDTRTYEPYQLLRNEWNGFGGFNFEEPPAECTEDSVNWCMEEDRNYLMMVDPPNGSSGTLGSSGGVVMAGTGNGIDWTLGEADVTGTLKITGRDSQDSLVACIRDSSRNASVMIMARCGRVIERANGVRSFAIDTAGMAGNSTELFVEYRSRFNILSDYVNFASNPLSVNYDFLPSQVQEHNGCSWRQKPNIIGKVTSNGVGVQTKVFTATKYRMPPTTTYSFGRGDAVSTSSDGSFKMCMPNSVAGLNVEGSFSVSVVTPNSTAASAISDFREISTCTGLTPCRFDVALSQSSFLTRITNTTGSGRSPDTSVYLEKSNAGFWDAQGTYQSNYEGVLTLGTLAHGAYRLRVTPGYCDGDEDCPSTSNGYVETFANFSVNESGEYSLGSGLTGTPLNSSLAMKEANVRLVVRTPDNELANAYADMGLLKETSECAQMRWSRECRSDVASGENGMLFAGVPNGVWTATIQDSSGSEAGSANLRITVTNEVVTAVEALTGAATLVNGTIEVTLPEMQLIFSFQDDSGQPARSDIQVSRVQPATSVCCGGGGSSMPMPSWVSTRNLQDGRLGIDVSTTSYLWIRSMPGRYWDETGSHFSNGVPTSKVFKVEFAGNILSKVSECTTFTLSSTNCSGSEEKSKVNGSYIFQSNPAKIIANVCQWPSSNEQCGVATDRVNVDIQIGSALQGYRTGVFNYQIENGTLKLNPKTDGNYFITLTPGWSNGGMPSTGNAASYRPIRLQILTTESGTRFWRCPDAQSNCVPNTPNLVELIPVAGIANLGNLRFVESTQIGYVKTPSGANVANSNINIQPEMGTPLPATSWAYSDLNGRFALDLPQGTYVVTAREPFVNPEQLVAGSLRLKITQVGDSTTMEVWENGSWVTRETLDLRLRNPNFSGRLLPPSGDSSRTFIANAYLNFERQDSISGMYQWTNVYGSTNSAGEFRIGLDDGNWRIKFEPPYDLRGEYTGTTILLVVSGGEVTSINGSACGPCTTDIRLPLPSLRGIVKDGQGNIVVNASLSARRLDWNYSPTDQWYSWTSTNNLGKYSFAIPSNGSTTMTRYEVRIEPPYMMPGSTSVSALATTTRYFGSVTRGGIDYLCALAGEYSTTCLEEEKEYGTSQDLVMNSANVFGQVLFNDAGVPAWIEVQKKNDFGDYQYTANSVSARSNGQFSVRLEQGIYKLTARPHNVSNGEAPGALYVLVRSDTTYCAATTPPNDTCTTSPSADINLESSNLRGTVKTESGEPITNIWLEPSKWNPDQSYWNSINGANIDGQGRFALRLIDDGPGASKYQLSVRIPEWYSSNVASKKFTIWVDDFIPGGSLNDLCEARLLIDCQGSNVWSAESNHDFVLGSGNVSGDVKDSAGNPVLNQYLQMEVSTGTDSWNWYNSSVSTNTRGRFALELDPGTYRFRVEPPSELRSNHSSIKQEITVADDGTWCLKNGSSCILGQDLNLRFELSNVRVHLDMTGVRSAWTNINRWRSGLDDCPLTPPIPSSNGSQFWQYWQCWELLNIHSYPNAAGDFSMQLPIGTYNVNTEFEKTDGTRSRVKFLLKVNSVEFRDQPVSDVPGIELLSGTPSVVDGVLQIAPPPPTVKGVLREPPLSGQLGNTVRWSWIEVQQKVVNDNGDSYWEWRDLGTGTGMNGNFGLNLEVPTSPNINIYRLRFRSNQGSLATFTADVLVNSEGKHSFDSNSDGVLDDESTWLIPDISWEVHFPIPNVTGLLTNSDGTTPVLGSWINAQRWISYGNNDNSGYWNWIDVWSSTDQTGRYSLVLPEGDYRLEVRPPWDSSDLAVFYAFVSVDSNGVATRCVSQEAMPCSGSQDEIDLSFPAPTLVGQLVRENGTNTPVSDSWISVQKKDGTNWQWSNTGASTNRNGRFALLLETGNYRLEINPPWYLANLGRFAVYFNIADDPDNVGEKLWCDATLTSNRDCVPANSASELVQIQMKLPNVVGTVMDKDLPSRQSWVGISGSDGYWNGTQTDANGTFRFILDDGTYTMYSYPNWSTSTSPYAVTEIVITNGSISTWKYLTPTVGTDECATVVAPALCEIEIELDRIPPNVSGTVRRGSATIEGAFVTVRKGSEVVARTITDSDGKYETYLPPLPADESYDIRVTIVEGQIVSSLADSVTPSGSMQIQDFDFASAS